MSLLRHFACSNARRERYLNLLQTYFHTSRMHLFSTRQRSTCMLLHTNTSSCGKHSIFRRFTLDSLHPGQISPLQTFAISYSIQETPAMIQSTRNRSGRSLFAQTTLTSNCLSAHTRQSTTYTVDQDWILLYEEHETHSATDALPHH